MKHSLLAALAVLGGLASAGPALATPITLTISGNENDASPNSGYTYSTTTGFNSAQTATPDFYSVSVSATGTSANGISPLPQPTLETSSIDARASGAGILYLWVTESNLTQPQGVFNMLSGFTTNTWTGDVTSVQEITYIDPTNSGIMGGTELASYTFEYQTDSVNFVNDTPTLTGLYSETAEYIITMSGAGSVNDTVNMANVPEPMSMAILGVGLLGVGAVKRRAASRS